MTAQKDLKKIIRARQQKTGESYTTARAHVLRDQAQVLDLDSSASTQPTSGRVQAVVLKVNEQSARIRILGAEGQVTFRSRDVSEVIPGHVLTLAIERRWTWRGDDYASGRVVEARLDASALGLAPLALDGGRLESVAEDSEPFVHPDPYAKMWKKLATPARPSFEFDGIAWGAFPGRKEDSNLTCDAAERVDAGDIDEAQDLLMAALMIDLRCIDAHAQLGYLEFQAWPERAMMHYDMGVRIGELSLPPGFNGLLVWGRLYNRPFLRSLHGYGLCLWRLGKIHEARAVFERILSFNPNDNQGIRFLLADLDKGYSWEQGREEEEREDRQERESMERARRDAQEPHTAAEIWIKQATAALRIKGQFGLKDALSYLVGEKLFNYVEAAEGRPELADELPNFVAWIKSNFESAELEAFLKTIRAKGSRRHHNIPDEIVRDRKRLERVRFLLLDSGKPN